MRTRPSQAFAFAVGCVFATTANANTLPQNPSGSHVDFYFTNLDFEVETSGFKESIDGNGYGLDFWFGNGIGLFTAEIQTNQLDGNVQGNAVEADARTLRAGMGYRFVNQPAQGAWIRAEYVQFDGDIDVQGFGSASDKQDGYAVHAGGMLGRGMVRGYGEIGFADLDDIDGYEYTVGINIQPGTVGGFLEFRGSQLETDEFDIDESFSDVRIGVRVAF